MQNLHDTKSVMLAALCFSEMFKKMVISTLPEQIETKTQMDVAIVLDEVGPLSMSAISGRLGIAPEQATRAMRDLRSAGLAECRKNEKNRRMVIARLTDEGRRVLADHKRMVHDNIAAYLDAIGEEDAQRLVFAAREAMDVLFAHDMDDPTRPIKHF